MHLCVVPGYVFSVMICVCCRCMHVHAMDTHTPRYLCVIGLWRMYQGLDSVALVIIVCVIIGRVVQ
jgi:hypothetical protein